MSNVSAKTAPIAAILAGAIIISAAISANGFGKLSDFAMALLVFIGFVIVLLGVGAYFWERDRYYEDQEDDRRHIHM